MERTEDLVPVPILSLPAEVSLLARTLSRTLPMQILIQLQKKQMSAGELASELGLRLNTLTYNLAVLEKVGLIKVRQIKWSCKGREVKIYAPAEQPVLLVPRQTGIATPSSWIIWKKLWKTAGQIFPDRQLTFLRAQEKMMSAYPPIKSTMIRKLSQTIPAMPYLFLSRRPMTRIETCIRAMAIMSIRGLFRAWYMESPFVWLSRSDRFR